MTKKQKSAKKSFISSVLVLCLCFTMFVGTTFAWYNDSVTSGRNTIVAGSLEMVLEKYIGTDGNFSVAANWETVTDQTKIFNETDGALTFEPGAVQVAYVRVKNEGDLAFKYSLAAKVYEEKAGTNQENRSFLLSDYLKFGQAQNVTAPFATREAAISAIGTAGKISDAELVPTANLQKKTTSGVIALVIYLPSNTDNEANPKPNAKPEISFGLNALATQYTVESDSFSNTYDENATYASAASTQASVPASGNVTMSVVATPSETANSTVVEFSGIDATTNPEVELSVETENIIANEGFTAGDIAQIDLTLTKSGTDTEVPFTSAKVTTYVAKGLTNPVIKYGTTETWTTDAASEAAVAGNTAYYDPATGKLVFVTTHFSEYTVTSNDTAYVQSEDKVYDSIEAAINAYSGSNDGVYLLKDISLSSIIMLNKSVTIYGKNNTITSTADRIIRLTTAGINLKVYDCKLISEAAGSDRRAISFDSASKGSSLLLNNCTAKAGEYTINGVNDSDNLTITIENNSYIEGWAAINLHGDACVVTVKDSTLVGINNYSGASNAFSTIVIDGSNLYSDTNTAINNVVSISNSTIIAKTNSDQAQHWISFQYGAANNRATVVVDKATKILDDINGNDKSADMYIRGVGNYVVLPLSDDQVAAVNAIGLVATPNGDGTYTVTTFDWSGVTFSTDNLVISEDGKTATGSVSYTYKGVTTTLNLADVVGQPWAVGTDEGTDYIFNVTVDGTARSIDLDISDCYSSGYTFYLS